MTYQEFPEGIYLVRRRSAEKGIFHYAVLVIGEFPMTWDPAGFHPLIVHQVPPRIASDWLENMGAWEVLCRASDTSAAFQRMEAACTNPEYAFFVNNCEQFARYVVTGVRESKQLQILGAVVAVFAIGFIVVDSEATGRRAG
jgi:hypothetical protein